MKDEEANARATNAEPGADARHGQAAVPRMLVFLRNPPSSPNRVALPRLRVCGHQDGAAPRWRDPRGFGWRLQQQRTKQVRRRAGERRSAMRAIRRVMSGTIVTRLSLPSGLQFADARRPARTADASACRIGDV
jgi:hypothetical protein